MGQQVRVDKFGPAIGTQPEADDVRMLQPEVELGEDRTAPATLLDMVEAVAWELLAGVEDDKISGVEQAADIVDADRHEALRSLQQVQRLAAAAHKDRLADVGVVKVRETHRRRARGCQRARRAHDTSAGIGFAG